MSGVNWAKGRLTVRAKKTKHHEADHAVRVVPIYPELRALLAEAFERAEPGATSIVPMASRPGVNLRTYLERIIGNAGHSLLPRLLQNLRASWAAASRALWLVRTRRRAASQSATRNAHPLRRELRLRTRPHPAARSRTKRQNPLPPFRLQRVLRNLRQLPKLARGRKPLKKTGRTGHGGPGAERTARLAGGPTKQASPGQDGRACVKWRGQDSNLRPRGYEPRELPGCSTPRHLGVT